MVSSDSAREQTPTMWVRVCVVPNYMGLSWFLKSNFSDMATEIDLRSATMPSPPIFILWCSPPILPLSLSFIHETNPLFHWWQFNLILSPSLLPLTLALAFPDISRSLIRWRKFGLHFNHIIDLNLSKWCRMDRKAWLIYIICDWGNHRNQQYSSRSDRIFHSKSQIVGRAFDFSRHDVVKRILNGSFGKVMNCCSTTTINLFHLWIEMNCVAGTVDWLPNQLI